MRPPRSVERLLARCLPPGPAGASILGDLHEEYAGRPRSARRDAWYLWVALRLAARYAAARTGARLWEVSRRTVRRREGHMIEDVRHALRLFRRRPGFTAVTVLTLALGIGATAAIFTVIDSALLRPLPYERPAELVDVWNTYPRWRGHEVLDRHWRWIALSYPEYRAWRDEQRSFAEVAAYGGRTAALTGPGEPIEVTVGIATASLFPLLGVEPVLGRTFGPGEEGLRAEPVALISERLWRARFGADPAAPGRTLELDGRPFTVSGVLPGSFRLRMMRQAGFLLADLWIPIGADGSDLHDRGHHAYEGMARLAPGVDLTAAAEETRSILGFGRDPEVRSGRVALRSDEERAGLRGPLLLLLGSVGLLMLVGCTNVATVMLGEVARRRRELATRAAIGAGRARLVRQLLTESTMLGLLGTAAGIGVAHVGVRLLVRHAPAGLHLPPGIGVDARVLLFCSGLGIACGILFGLLPAFAAARGDVSSALRLGAGSARRIGWRSQQALIVGEVALALVLLVSAGLLARSLAATFAVPPGFLADRLATMEVRLSGPDYESEEATVSFFRELARSAASLPGVQAMSGSTPLPFSGSVWSSSFEIEGRPKPEGMKGPEANRQTVLPRFHETMSIPVIAGRGIGERDTAEAPPVVVISESLAARYFPAGSPLGARLLRDGRAWEVVGVVGDVLHSDLQGEPQSTFYFPFYQQPMANLSLVLRTAVEPTALAHSLRRAVWDLDPRVPAGEVTTVGGLLARSAAEERYRTFLLASFGMAAALLTGVGIFGVTARAVTGRMREFGIRAALGARRASIVALVMRREAAALVFGLALGVAGALAAGRLLSGFLFGVRSTDPLTFTSAILFLAALGALASYLPARRALRQDPGQVLRAE